MKRAAILLAIAVFAATLSPDGSAAQVRTMQLADNDPAVTNHWPVTDALLGTGDDVVNANPSALQTSDPNTSGSWSFNAFDFTGIGAATDPWMPAGMQAMTFLSGTVDVDTGVAQSGGGAIITDWALSGSQPFAGHGPYNSSIAAVNSGTYSTSTGAFTLDVDFAATLGGGPDTSASFMMTGTAFLVDSPFPPTGNSYVDNTLVPIAQATGATGLFFISGGGTVPAANGGSWPAMPVVATLVALSPNGTAVEGSTWAKIKELYR